MDDPDLVWIVVAVAVLCSPVLGVAIRRAIKQHRRKQPLIMPHMEQRRRRR